MKAAAARFGSRFPTAHLLPRQPEQRRRRRERALGDAGPHRLRADGERRELHLEGGLDRRGDLVHHLARGGPDLELAGVDRPAHVEYPRGRRLPLTQAVADLVASAGLLAAGRSAPVLVRERGGPPLELGPHRGRLHLDGVDAPREQRAAHLEHAGREVGRVGVRERDEAGRAVVLSARHVKGLERPAIEAADEPAAGVLGSLHGLGPVAGEGDGTAEDGHGGAHHRAGGRGRQAGAGFCRGEREPTLRPQIPSPASTSWTGCGCASSSSDRWTTSVRTADNVPSVSSTTCLQSEMRMMPCLRSAERSSASVSSSCWRAPRCTRPSVTIRTGLPWTSRSTLRQRQVANPTPQFTARSVTALTSPPTSELSPALSEFWTAFEMMSSSTRSKLVICASSRRPATRSATRRKPYTTRARTTSTTTEVSGVRRWVIVGAYRAEARHVEPVVRQWRRRRPPAAQGHARTARWIVRSARAAARSCHHERTLDAARLARFSARARRAAHARGGPAAGRTRAAGSARGGSGCVGHLRSHACDSRRAH